MKLRQMIRRKQGSRIRQHRETLVVSIEIPGGYHGKEGNGRKGFDWEETDEP